MIQSCDVFSLFFCLRFLVNIDLFVIYLVWSHFYPTHDDNKHIQKGVLKNL